ncbi:hypothetical protein OS493_000692 [Desmophyllum pertusum]|uniref:Uncharacterized protein n=1 Tax=Desmophyllum pertusum TaxID=174260 RepID=A0A9X0DBW0_9CNID|nr:hypothetical protein OS493_000692 [Desmophyllum pertusum]
MAWREFANKQKCKRTVKGKKQKGECSEARDEIVVQRMSSDVSGKQQKYSRSGTQEYVRFEYDELNFDNIKDACQKHFAPTIEKDLDIDPYPDDEGDPEQTSTSTREMPKKAKYDDNQSPYSQSVEVSTDGTQKVIAKDNPMSSPAVKQTIKQLVRRSSRPTRKDTRQGRVAYESKKAPPFTLQQLARMRQYCLKTIEGLRGLWLWTVTLFSFALFLRGEEPLRLKLRHLKLPQNYAADSGRMPQRIEVKIPWSKADKKAKGDL